MVRVAKFTDTAGILLLLREGFARSVYASRDGAEIDEAATKKLLLNAMQRHGGTNGGACFVEVAETAGQITGVILGTLQRVYSIGNKLMATDLFWYASQAVEPGDPIKLMRDMIAWAKSSPHVIEVKCGTTAIIRDDPEEAGIILTRLGLTPYGRIYRMET